MRSRNTLGLMQSGETGDAAELLARWGPRGRFEGGGVSSFQRMLETL